MEDRLLHWRVPALYVFVIRRAIPESPRFLLSKGRAAQAEMVVSSVEKASGVSTPRTSGRHALLTSTGHPEKALARDFWSYGPASTSAGPLCSGSSGSPSSTRTTESSPGCPHCSARTGAALTTSFEYVLIITLAQVPGYFSAALLVDKIGRKWTLAPYLFLTGSGLSSSATRGGQADILFWGCFMSFFNLGAWGVVYTYTPELYPTRIRGTGAGWAAAFGRAAGVIAPLVVGTDAGHDGADPRAGVSDVRRRSGDRRTQRPDPGRGNQGEDP